MLKIETKITITPENGTPFEIEAKNEISVTSSYESLTDKAKVMFPRNINFDGKNVFTGLNPLFKRGDRIKIEAGYGGKLRTWFIGYITKIGANLPVVLECEDEMWKLKKTKVTFPNATGTLLTANSGRKLKAPITVSDPVTLNKLLDFILPDGIKYKIVVNKPTGKGYTDDVNLGQFRATNVSVTEILDTLRKEYGLFSYFTNEVTTVGSGITAKSTEQTILHVGLPSNAVKSNTEEFAFEETIINSDTLEYQQADDLFIKVVAISMDANNTKKQVEVGDADGVQRTYYTYNASDDDLKTFANAKLKEVKYSGYTGSIYTFGEPFVRHGDIAKVTSKKLPERDGFYQIKSVEYSLTVENGLKQTIELGTFVGKAFSEVNIFKQNGSV